MKIKREFLRSISGGNYKMIKEKYLQLMLSRQMGGITKIGVTNKLAFMQRNRETNE